MSQLRDEIHDSYRAWAPSSERLIESARRSFPGGDTRMSAHFGPYPLFIERAAGCRMYDADGHEIVDFMNNFTSLMLGHANPAVVKAVSDQMARGGVRKITFEFQMVRPVAGSSPVQKGCDSSIIPPGMGRSQMMSSTFRMPQVLCAVSWSQFFGTEA
jgi:hypothetical protein